MKATQCPYCREEIKPEALTCKHCHTRLRLTKEEKLILAIQRRINPVAYQATVAQLGPAVTTKPVSAHTHKYHPMKKIREPNQGS